MESLADRNTLIKQYVSVMAGLAGRKVETLLRRDLGRDINFEVAEPIFLEIHEFFALAVAQDWNRVPFTSLLKVVTVPGMQSNLSGDLANLNLLLNEVSTFTLKGNDPETRRNKLVDDVQITWLRCYQALAPSVMYLTSTSQARNQDLENRERELHKRGEEVISNLNGLHAQAVQQQQRVEATLKSVEAAAKQVGVTQEAVHFSKLANNYFRVSLVWIAFALFFGIGAFYYANTHLSQSPLGDTATLARFMIPRLVIISLLLTGLVFCLRNFAACSHNLIVNRHRQTSLSTFQTFVNGTSDPDTKDAVLLQATRSIFAPQASGFLKGEADAPQVSQVTEVVRDLAGKPK